MCIFVIAALAFPLGYFVSVWNGEGFAFQHRNADLAKELSKKIGWEQELLSIVRPHLGSEHACRECRQCADQLPVRAAASELRLAHLESRIRWHRFLAGPLLNDPSSIRLKGGSSRGPCAY